MAVRILIEREVESHSEALLQEKLLMLRSLAIKSPGYISGETLRSVTDPYRFLVISTWNSLDEWKAWEADPGRRKLQEEIEAILRCPSKVSVYRYP